MSYFVYRAVNNQGKEQKGGMPALDEAEILQDIKFRNLHPLEVREVSETEFYRLKTSFQPKKFRFIVRKKIPIKTLVFFLRDLASMVGAGLVITRSLEILRDQVHQGHIRQILDSLREIVSQGHPLSEALRKYPEAFPPLISEMVVVGEHSGRLEEILNRLAIFYERQEEMEARFKQAMVYPIVILIVAFAAVTAFLTIALPRFVTLFEEVKAELPPITLFLIALSNLLRHYGIPIVLALMVSVSLFRTIMVRSITVQKYVQGLFLKIPIFGPLYLKIILSRILRAFSAMYRSGIPILVIFSVIPLIVRNIIFEASIRRIEASIRRGESLAEAFFQEKVFPPVIANILYVGAEAGKLEDSLDRLAVRFEDEVDRISKALGTLLEPFFIVMMGGFVLFVALALFMPMVRIVTVLSESSG